MLILKNDKIKGICSNEKDIYEIFKKYRCYSIGGKVKAEIVCERFYKLKVIDSQSREIISLAGPEVEYIIQFSEGLLLGEGMRVHEFAKMIGIDKNIEK